MARSVLPVHLSARHAAAMPPYRYSVYGLRVVSDLECPELPPLDASDVGADVRVRLGTVPERVADARHTARRVQVADGVFQLAMEGVARYRVETGRRVTVEPEPGARPGDVRLYLLGTVFGVLLHQLGRLPLHASAVALDGRVFAFAGNSGAGKSTLAAALHRRGLAMLGDDIGVVRANPAGAPWFYPGFPRVKLWRDAVDHFALDHRALTPDWTRADKFHLRLQESFQREPMPLAGVYFLTRADADATVCIAPLPPREGVPLLATQTYRSRLIPLVGDVRGHFRDCARLAQTVALRRFTRPWALARLDESVDHLLADMRAFPG